MIAFAYPISIRDRSANIWSVSVSDFDGYGYHFFTFTNIYLRIYIQKLGANTDIAKAISNPYPIRLRPQFFLSEYILSDSYDQYKFHMLPHKDNAAKFLKQK